MLIHPFYEGEPTSRGCICCTAHSWIERTTREHWAIRPHINHTHRRARIFRRTRELLIVAIAVIGQVVAAPWGFAKDDTPQADDPIGGNVFVMTNSPNRVLGNQVVMYNRFESGRL